MNKIIPITFIPRVNKLNLMEKSNLEVSELNLMDKSNLEVDKSNLEVRKLNLVLLAWRSKC